METVPALIEAIEVEDFEGVVFNLETGTEEYVVADVVVHNCPHFWQTYPKTPYSCGELWMGEG